LGELRPDAFFSSGSGDDPGFSVFFFFGGGVVSPRNLGAGETMTNLLEP
jgi:hypothetical protein